METTLLKIQDGGHFHDGPHFRYGCNEITPTITLYNQYELSTVAPVPSVGYVDIFVDSGLVMRTYVCAWRLTDMKVASGLVAGGDDIVLIASSEDQLQQLSCSHTRVGMNRNAVGIKIRCTFFDNRSAF